MNHWFLCARDLMYLFISLLPLLFSFSAGQYFESSFSNERENVLFNLFFAILIQSIGINLLYNGVIK